MTPDDQETPPWHPYCGCAGCRAGNTHGRRAVKRIEEADR